MTKAKAGTYLANLRKGMEASGWSKGRELRVRGDDLGEAARNWNRLGFEGHGKAIELYAECSRKPWEGFKQG